MRRAVIAPARLLLTGRYGEDHPMRASAQILTMMTIDVCKETHEYPRGVYGKSRYSR